MIMDLSKLKYVPADNYYISLVLKNNERVCFLDYDHRIRTFAETGHILDEIATKLSTNPFGKVKLTIVVGYDAAGAKDRDMLLYIVDGVIRKHRTCNIRIERKTSNIKSDW